MKIASIVGARPQFIKLASLSKKIRHKYREVIIHTGQHYDNNMSDQFLTDLEIPSPRYNLGIGSYSQGKQTGRMIEAIEEVLKNEKPNLAIVFGDTNSTLAGALAAAKMHVPIVHVEAGLRSFNREMPEEINRVLTDHSSDYLFAPTQTAFHNLKREGLLEKSYLTGDIMVDVLKDNINRIEKSYIILEHLNLRPKGYYLLTLHRPYNVDNKIILGKILNSLSQVNQSIVFPIHPRTEKMIKKFKLEVGENIKIIEPVGYLNMIYLEKNSSKVITDSGGIQKEAYILEIPCITIRTETEWVETVKAGWNILVNPDVPNLSEIIESFIPVGNQNKIFGENVAERMVEIISEKL